MVHRDPREQFRSATSDLPPDSLGEGAWRHVTFRYVVLGAVLEDESLAHALYRRYWGAEDHAGSLHVLTCSRGDTGWGLDITLEWDMALTNFAYSAGAFEEGER